MSCCIIAFVCSKLFAASGLQVALVPGDSGRLLFAGICDFNSAVKLLTSGVLDAEEDEETCWRLFCALKHALRLSKQAVNLFVLIILKFRRSDHQGATPPSHQSPHAGLFLSNTLQVSK